MTGIIIAAVIIGLTILIGGAVMFLLLPVLMALLGMVALVLVMVVVAVLMVPNFVTLDDFKPEIINMLKQSTGREIAIGGPIGFTLWPVLGLQLQDISIGNPPRSETPIFMAAQQLGVGVTLSSLLDRRLELRELRVVGGQLNLAVDERGHGNWNFKPQATTTDDAPAAATQDTASAEGQDGKNQFSIKDVQIEKIEVVDTNISYDTTKGDPVDLDHINLSLSMPSLDKPLAVKGNVTFHDMMVKLEGSVEKPRAIMDNKATPLSVTLGLGGDEVRLDGTMQGTSFKGDIEAGIANLSALAAWAGAGQTQLPVKVINLAAALEADAAHAALSNLSLKLDDMTVAGKATASWSGVKPRLVADVDVSSINLDKLMPASAAGSAPAATASGCAADCNAAPDLSALDAVNADITARLAGLVYKGAQLGSTTAKIGLNAGRLQASITPASLYEGTVAVKADVSAANRGARSFTSNVVLDGVQIGPVLTQFAGSDRLTGKGDLTLNLSGPVAAPDVIKRELGGDGSFMLRDGALKGVNLAALIRRAKSMLSGGAAAQDSGPVQTDFTELSGTMRITNGVIANNDLKMLSPLVRVTGSGTASLPQNNLDYRIEAALVADLTGQGGVLQQKGLVIPVNVKGPFDNLSYQPDLQGLVLNNVGAAKDIGSAVQGLGTKEGQRNARDAVKGLLGLPTSQQQAAPATTTDGTVSAPPAAPPPPPATPQNVLKNLLGR